MCMAKFEATISKPCYKTLHQSVVYPWVIIVTITQELVENEEFQPHWINTFVCLARFSGNSVVCNQIWPCLNSIKRTKEGVLMKGTMPSSQLQVRDGFSSHSPDVGMGSWFPPQVSSPSRGCLEFPDIRVGSSSEPQPLLVFLKGHYTISSTPECSPYLPPSQVCMFPSKAILDLTQARHLVQPEFPLLFLTAICPPCPVPALPAFPTYLKQTKTEVK